MTQIVEQRTGTGLLPGDPAGLRLSLRVEYRPAAPEGRAAEDWSLLVRHEQLQPGQAPGQLAFRTDLDHVGVVSIRRVPLSRGTIAPDVFDDLTGRDREPALDQDVLTAVADAAFTRRNGQIRLAPGVRSCLGKGPRSDLGDLLVVDNFSVTSSWAVWDLDILLLGEAITRAAAAGPCFVATAPFHLRTSQGNQQAVGALCRVGFRPLAGHTMVTDVSGVPRLTGPAGQSLIRSHRDAS